MDSLLQDIKYLGRYQLIRILGKGGMSTVYLAEDTQLNRQVAIKCVENTSSQAKFVARLQLEAKMLAQLNHPNIVQLYDVIEHEHILGLVIEFVEGHSLIEKRRQATDDIEQNIDWLIQIANGLEYAHQAGIVHCDLKPENIMVTATNSVKIADFGIAKAMLGRLLDDNGLTEIDKVSGSYFSLSPEQATGQAVDYRTDLFSLGILIHLLLTDEHPFGNTQNHFLVVQRIINEPFSLNAKTQSLLSAEHIHLIRTLLDKDPQRRRYRAGDVAELLSKTRGSVFTGESRYIDATLELPIAERIETTKRRFSAIPWVTSIVMLALIIVSSWYWVNRPVETRYVAIASAQVTASEEFDQDLLSQIRTTLEQSAQQALLGLPTIGLIGGNDFLDLEGSLAEKARGSGASVVILPIAHCVNTKCDLQLQKLTGEQMLLSQQKSWPVLIDSLVGIRASMLKETRALFPLVANSEDSSIEDIDESDYRQYLSIYDATSAGSRATHENLLALENLQVSSPYFEPVYFLFTRVAVHLFKESGNISHLDQLSKILERAPQALQNSSQLLQSNFELLLQKNNLTAAQETLTEIRKIEPDLVLHNDLEASLAYAQNDHSRVLQLDRNNAALMPSTWRYYNLATSEYTLGNFSEAKLAAEKALELYPGHLYSLNLSAAISLSMGQINTAVATYKNIVADNPGGDSLSNYGLALALKGNFEEAIRNHLRATQTNPNNPAYLINLADAHSLAGQKTLATENYFAVLELVKQPSNAQEYSIQAQAQAHLGEFNQAIKTLKAASERFPEVSELNYAAAIVHTLAGNENAAIVEVENAVERGTGRIWFQFAWFKPLCSYPQFAHTINVESNPFCLVKENLVDNSTIQ